MDVANLTDTLNAHLDVCSRLLLKLGKQLQLQNATVSGLQLLREKSPSGTTSEALAAANASLYETRLDYTLTLTRKATLQTSLSLSRKLELHLLGLHDKNDWLLLGVRL